MKRVEIRGARENYLADYDEINLILDTAPYPGGAMTATAMCKGVPVLAKAGENYGSRFADEILTAANCREFIAKDDDDYVKKAVLAARGELVAVIDTTKLTDKNAYMRDVERAYENIFNEIA